MIADILPYIGSYDDVRALLGVPDDELYDETLALTLYKDHLTLVLSKEGTYPSGGSSQTLQEIFDGLTNSDKMYSAIRRYSTYAVADCVAGALPMIGVKTKTDGKSNITRHSAESVYQDTVKSIKIGLSGALKIIQDYLEEDAEEGILISAVPPTTDIITEY